MLPTWKARLRQRGSAKYSWCPLARLIHDFRARLLEQFWCAQGRARALRLFLPLIGSDFDNALEDYGG